MDVDYEDSALIVNYEIETVRALSLLLALILKIPSPSCLAG